MKRLFFSSLRTRMIILVLLAVVPLALVSAYRDYRAERDIRRQLTGNARKYAALSLREEDRQIDRVRTFLIAISHFKQAGGAPCDDYMRDLIEHYPDFSNIGVIGADGMLKCSALPFKAPVDLSDRSYFRRAVKTKNFAIGDYQVGRVTKKGTVNFGYPVLDGSGNVESVFFVALDLSAFSATLAGTFGKLLPEGATVTNIGPDGVIISSYPDNAPAGRPASGIPVLKKVLEAKADVVETGGPDGVPTLYLVLPLHSRLEGEGITAVVGVPQAAVFADADRMFAGSIATIAVVLGLCITLAVKGGERYIFGNIDKLTKTAERISRGELSTRTGIPYEEGELGRLASTVDEMAASLQERNRQVDDAMEAIKHMEAKYRSLVERIPAITYTTAVGSFYDFIYISPRIEPMLGHKPGELTAGPDGWFNIIHPADVKRLTEEVALLYETGDPFASEYRVLTRDGGYLWLHDEAVLVRGESGNPLTYQGIMLDVTGRKRRELELEAIASLSSELRRAHTSGDMPPIILETIDGLLDTECSALALTEGHDGETVIRHGFGKCEEWVGRRLPDVYDAGFSRLDKGRPYIYADASDDPLLIETGMRGHIVSSLCSPIVFHGQPTGWLWLGLKSAVTVEDIRVVSAVCDIAANALHRERLFDLTERRLEKLSALRSIQ